MNDASSSMIQSPSQINYNYATIKITQSRIDKGLIAIPVSLAKWFPAHNESIQIYLGDSPVSETKQYSSYTSSTRECRIGGVRQWFQDNAIKSGDEIVIQFIDKEHFIYKLIPERNFLSKTKELENSFDSSETEHEATDKILTLSQWTQSDKNKVTFSEYHRLINTLANEKRRYTKRSPSRERESVPANLRALLADIHKGHCQICDFWFLKKDNNPYFEIHHLDPEKGHHPQNLIVVCGNCHSQLEYAYVKQEFNDEHWLIEVAFNRKLYKVNQPVLIMKKEAFFKKLYI